MRPAYETEATRELSPGTSRASPASRSGLGGWRSIRTARGAIISGRMRCDMPRHGSSIALACTSTDARTLGANAAAAWHRHARPRH
jgi:hypothetical protein